MNQHEIGNKLSELRKKKGLTQEELAIRCGVNVRSIQRIEAGTVSPRVATLKLIGVELDYEIPFDENDDTNYNPPAERVSYNMYVYVVVFIILIIITYFIYKRVIKK